MKNLKYFEEVQIKKSFLTYGGERLFIPSVFFLFSLSIFFNSSKAFVIPDAETEQRLFKKALLRLRLINLSETLVFILCGTSVWLFASKGFGNISPTITTDITVFICIIILSIALTIGARELLYYLLIYPELRHLKHSESWSLESKEKYQKDLLIELKIKLKTDSSIEQRSVLSIIITLLVSMLFFAFFLFSFISLSKIHVFYLSLFLVCAGLFGASSLVCFYDLFLKVKQKIRF